MNCFFRLPVKREQVNCTIRGLQGKNYFDQMNIFGFKIIQVQSSALHCFVMGDALVKELLFICISVFNVNVFELIQLLIQ